MKVNKNPTDIWITCSLLKKGFSTRDLLSSRPRVYRELSTAVSIYISASSIPISMNKIGVEGNKLVSLETTMWVMITRVCIFYLIYALYIFITFQVDRSCKLRTPRWNYAQSTMASIKFGLWFFYKVRLMIIFNQVQVQAPKLGRNLKQSITYSSHVKEFAPSSVFHKYAPHSVSIIQA